MQRAFSGLHQWGARVKKEKWTDATFLHPKKLSPIDNHLQMKIQFPQRESPCGNKLLLKVGQMPSNRWSTENELNSVSGDAVVINLFCTILAVCFVAQPFSHLKEMEMNFLVGHCFSVFTGCTRTSFSCHMCLCQLLSCVILCPKVDLSNTTCDFLQFFILL